MARPLLLSLLLLFCVLTQCATRTTIVNSVPEREANEIVVLLHSKGIEAEKIPAPVSGLAGTPAEKLWDITVAPQQVTEALAILNQVGLPRIKGTSLLDLFGAQGLVPSDLQDKIRYQEGLSEQLATTIRKMDGIIDANVQITFPSDEELHKEMTASVYVKHRGILDNPSSLAIVKIKRLIASAVPGLTPENVTVVTDRALYADLLTGAPEPMSEEKEYVSIWSVVVAKQSAMRFRLIFYVFIILLFLLLCTLLWLGWKCFPIIQEQGGITSLFHPEPYKRKETPPPQDTE